MISYDARHDMAIYNVPDPHRVMAACADAVRLANGYVAVPASLENLQRLRAAELPIIPPLRAYGWPGQFTPFHTQKITSNFLAATPRAFVLSDMGTGKTLAALWAADYLMQEHEGLRCLIVAPLSTLRTVWADAIFATFLHRRKAVILHGDAEKRRKLLAQPADFYIINPDGLTIGVPAAKRRAPMTGLALDLANRPDIQLVIVDEASVYRGSQTRRHRAARALLAPRPYLWLMTGTPVSNGPLDAYGQAFLVNGAGGESFRAYRDRVMYRDGPFKWFPRRGAQKAAFEMLKPAVRFKISDCLDLPPCTIQTREVELSADQKDAYRRLRRTCQLQVGEGKLVNAVNQAVLRWKLLQVVCGAIYDGEHFSHLIDCTPRLQEVSEIIEQCGEKIIIFAPLTNVLEVLSKHLKDVPHALINGQVPIKERTEIFRAFQREEKPRVILADPRTMAHGVTLTAASTIIWFAPIDQTELYLQANKRIDRPGQVKNTSIVQLASSPVEREIYRRLSSNESLQGAILKMVETP